MERREDVFFARYEARRSDAEPAEPLENLWVRAAVPADADAIAALAFEREGGVLEEHRNGAERELASGRSDNLLLVAEVEGCRVGFARARYFEHPVEPPAGLAPQGWYLLGVIVTPPFRRRGIATELTRRRLEWIAQHTTEAFYFVNARNRASIELHEHFGFVELTRDFTFPKVSFTGGVGILYRTDLSTHASRTFK
jgi:ribosomal protein S18 acetylase RimI-like enzyme